MNEDWQALFQVLTFFAGIGIIGTATTAASLWISRAHDKRKRDRL